MKNEKETKEKLLASAKKEFLEKGFMQASLRSICKNAGVTTGALYFFFEDKEDLFAALVNEPLQQLYEVMNQHYMDEMNQVSEIHQLNETEEFSWDFKEDFKDDLEACMQIIHHMYQYYDEFQLLLNKSQGSYLEQCVDWFVDITEKHYRILADQLSKKANTKRVEDYMIHWVSHMMVDIFVHMLSHETSEEEAMKHMQSISRFIVGGWFELFKK